MDCEVLSRYYKNCALRILLKETSPAVYEAWKLDHEGKCRLNHEGSASSMESAAAVIQNVMENIYRSTKIVKYERVDNRLRKLCQRVTGLCGEDKTTEVTRKTLDQTEIKVTKKVKGKLTDASIDILQNYFRIALRSGAKSVPELKKLYFPVFFHLASSEDCNFHIYCPAKKDNWCQYQRDLINGTNLYKPGKGFHDNVIKHVETRVRS